MDDAPTVVGINRTQDASIAVARGRSHVASLQKERLTRRKHHWGRLGDVRDRYLPSFPELREPLDLVVECYSSDSEVENRDAYHDELAENLRFRGEMRVEQVSHHLAHLYSAFHPSLRGGRRDGDRRTGSRVRDISEPFPGAAGAAPELLEIASFYDCDRAGRIDCIGKQLWDGDWDRPVGLGCFYYLLTRMMFPSGEGNEGKVMGLAPFGRRGALGLPELVVDEYRVLIPDEWQELFAERERFLFPTADGASIADSANLAAEGQQAFESALLRVARWLADETGQTNLCYAGGAALNCSANGRLVRESAFRGVFIPPSPHDGGTAVGCALYGMIAVLGQPSDFRWSHDFLGPEIDESALEAALNGGAEDLVVERPQDLLERVVEILAGGGVIAVHNGRSESGPRALGNRSIIADARHPAMQDHINFNVKGREWFRPLATRSASSATTPARGRVAGACTACPSPPTCPSPCRPPCPCAARVAGPAGRRGTHSTPTRSTPRLGRRSDTGTRSPSHGWSAAATASTSAPTSTCTPTAGRARCSRRTGCCSASGTTSTGATRCGRASSGTSQRAGTSGSSAATPPGGRSRSTTRARFGACTSGPTYRRPTAPRTR